MRHILGACLLVGIMSHVETARAHPDTGPKPRSAPELGKVRWWRDYEGAKAAAEASRKPLLILFDEVPG